MCTFVENIAVGICCTNILFLLYSFLVKNDKNKCYIFTTIASIGGLLIQVIVLVKILAVPKINPNIGSCPKVANL